MSTDATVVRMPLFAIKTSKKSRCFDIKGLQFNYIQQNNAWSDVRNMKGWFTHFLS